MATMNERLDPNSPHYDAAFAQLRRQAYAAHAAHEADMADPAKVDYHRADRRARKPYRSR